MQVSEVQGRSLMDIYGSGPFLESYSPEGY